MKPWTTTLERWDAELTRTGERAAYGKGWYGLKVAHEIEVACALRDGEQVPAAVLALYPSLPKGAHLPERETRRPAPVATPVVTGTLDAGTLTSLGKRWLAGSKIAALAKEVGMSWNRLWAELDKLGYNPWGAAAVG